MDALALLCTLHAEGPRTLRLLREAGCRDIREFLALDAEVVSALLDVPLAVARRLGREGDHLAGRVGAEFLEPEDGAPAALESLGGAPPTETPSPLALPHASVAAQTQSIEDDARVEEGTASPVGERLARTEQNILGRVLERWRESDETQPARQPDPEPEAELDPDPGPPAEEQRLEISGVPSAALRALEAAGFSTSEAVAESNAMALATAVGCSFGDGRRFQYLAARAVGAGLDEVAPPVESANIQERLIERPEQRPEQRLGQPPASAVPERGDAPFETSPVTASAPAGGAGAAAEVEPPSNGSSKTVLNWDFVAEPPADEERASPEAGGPFA